MASELEYFIGLLLLLVLGVLGASSVIVSKKPDAKQLIEKLAKVSGWVGLVSALWGLWLLIWCLRTIELLGHLPLVWLTWLLSAAVMIGLGFVFGYGMVTTYLSDQAKAKGEQVRQKLVAYQLPLGYLSLGLFVWWILLRYVIY